MKKHTSWIALAALLSGAISTLVSSSPLPLPEARPAQRASRIVTVVFVRHAEKLPRTKEERDPGLTKVGHRRAARLAELLQAAGVTHVFSTDLRRTKETAGAVADALKLQVELYGARQTKKFVTKLEALSDGDVAVVVGHSNTVPQMIKALGGELSGLDERGFLRESEHDRVIVQTLCADTLDGPLRAVATVDLRVSVEPE